MDAHVDPRRDGWLRRRALIAWVLLLVTALPWGSTLSTADPNLAPVGSTNSGADRIKLLVAVLAIFVAFLGRRPRRMPVVLVPLLLYAVIAAVAAMSAAGSRFDPFLRAGRFGVTILACGWVAARLGMATVLKTLAVVSAAFGYAALFGFLTGRADRLNGRVAGWPLTLHPNALALVLGCGLIAVISLWITKEIRRWWWVPTGMMLAVTFVMTGSRSALSAGGVALAATILVGTPKRAAVFAWALLLLLPLAGFIQANTSHHPFTTVTTRGGNAVVDTTFTGRTFAWDAALHANQTTRQQLVGQGLSVKEVAVDRPGVDRQTVDGSFYAGYLQTGLLGVSLLCGACLFALVRSARGPRRMAAALIVFVLGTAWFESTLNDVTFTLVVLAAASAALPKWPKKQAVETVPVPTAAGVWTVERRQPVSV